MGNSTNKPKVIIVGGGYGGVAAAKALDSRCDVTVIESRGALTHKFALLRASVVPGWEKRTVVPLDKLLKKGKVMKEDVIKVETGRVTLNDGSILTADFVILAHGQGYGPFPFGFTSETSDKDSFFNKLKEKQALIAKAKNIVIVGGGPTGVELAGEITAQHPGKKVTIVHSGERLLSNSALPVVQKAYNLIMERLTNLGVTVKVGVKLTNLPPLADNDAFLAETTTYNLSDGSTISADLLIVAAGSFHRNGNIVDAVDERNRVKVTDTLMVEGMDGVFCIGDASNVNETKMGYLAGKQGVHVSKNVLLAAKKKPLKPYVPMDGQKKNGIFFIPLGPKVGVGAIGTTVLKDGMTSTIKGKGLFSKKVFGDANQTPPPL